MKALKFLFKIMILPLVLLIEIVDALGMLLMRVSCYVMGPIMLLLAGCAIYGLCTQTWYNVAIALGCEAVCALVMFGGAVVISEMDVLKDYLLHI